MGSRISKRGQNAVRSSQIVELMQCVTDTVFSPLSSVLCTVGERSVGRRRCAVRHTGGIRSANADVSSDNGGERPPRRKPKVSCATLIGAGLVGT